MSNLSVIWAHSVSSIILFAIAVGCGTKDSSSLLTKERSANFVAKISAVEANVWRNNHGQIESDMGPTSAIACQGDYFKKRHSRQGFYYIAPSDTLMNEWLGRGLCGPNPDGGEPACKRYRDLCGAIVAIHPQQGVGSRNLSHQVMNGWVHNAMGYAGKQELYREIAQQGRDQIDYLKDDVPPIIYAVINDFCPKLHSVNKPSNQCAGNQIDLGPGVWFSLIPAYKVDSNNWLDPRGVTLTSSLLWESGGNLKKVYGNEWMLGPQFEAK